MVVINWLLANYVELLLTISAVVGAAEAVVRLTPTKADDGAVERIGKVVRQILDFLKIPNVKKK